MGLVYSLPDEIERFTKRFAPVLDAVEQCVQLGRDLLEESLGGLQGEPPTVIWMLGAACLTEFEEMCL
jgi:hypothetical protein